MAGTTEEERALSGYCHMRVQGWLNLRVSTTPKRRGLASNRNVMGIYATMRQTRHPRIRDPARIWTWTRICVIVAPRESRILTWTWWSRRRSFCVANKLTRSALSRLHCRSCACVTVTHRRLFESFASRVERLRSIDLAVARTPARTCVSAIDPKASTESWRYQTSPLSLGSDHQSSREGTDCLLSISQPFKSCRHPSLVSFPPRPWKPPVRSNIGVSLAFSPLRRPPASKTT